LDILPAGQVVSLWGNAMDAIDFFVLQHGWLHLQVEGDFLHGLSDAQMRRRPDGLNSIAWLIWHMPRCEDALNLRLVGRPQCSMRNTSSLSYMCRSAMSGSVWMMTR
jgi:hypothetical protein